MSVILSEISKLFESAEAKIKLIEHLDDGLLFSAVNQLRYVSFHLLRFHGITDNDLKNEELRKAKNHCQRSIYDAMEIGIAHYLEQIQDFQQDYKLIVVSDIVPTYLEINKMAEEVTLFLSENTRNSLDERCDERCDNYKESIKKFNELREAANLLKFARLELNKKMRNKRIALMFSISTLIIALISVLIAILK